MGKYNAAIRKLVLFFWSGWFSLVTLTNIFDLLKKAGIARSGWLFASGNFELIAKVTSIYALPAFINWLLFIIVILVEIACSFFFWKAFLQGKDELVNRSHLAGLTLFAGFLLADEFFVNYGQEDTHMQVFFGLLISITALKFLKSEPGLSD